MNSSLLLARFIYYNFYKYNALHTLSLSFTLILQGSDAPPECGLQIKFIERYNEAYPS